MNLLTIPEFKMIFETLMEFYSEYGASAEEFAVAKKILDHISYVNHDFEWGPEEVVHLISDSDGNRYTVGIHDLDDWVFSDREDLEAELIVEYEQKTGYKRQEEQLNEWIRREQSRLNQTI